MATSPQFTEYREEHPKFPPQRKKKAAPWVPFAIIVAAAILIALIIWLPQTPKKQLPPNAALVPGQPTGAQVQLRDLRITPAPVENQVYLSGTLVNTGNTAINGVLLDATFVNAQGQNLGTIRRPVEGVVGGSNVATQPLSEVPIKPNEARPIRISFANVPQGWNHQLPAITLVGVTTQGARK